MAMASSLRAVYRQFEFTTLRQAVSGLRHSPGKRVNRARVV
jgi:hypothetical protein